jgi:putative transcriptional regulator
MKSLQGHFLVASRHLQDANFARTVVLILEHHSEGAIGLVLNRPTQRTVAEVWKMVETTPCMVEAPLSLGGPVQGPLMCLTGSGKYADAKVLEGVYVTSQRDKVRQTIGTNPLPVKVFAGYAGWGAGQLESELEVGGWFVIPASPELVFSESPDELWPVALRMSGRDFYRDTLHIKQFPDDASLN